MDDAIGFIDTASQIADNLGMAVAATGVTAGNAPAAVAGIGTVAAAKAVSRTMTVAKVARRSINRRVQQLAKKQLQQHHIVVQSLRDHPVVDLLGFNIDSRKNLISLPKTRLAHPTRTVHFGKHRNAYTDEVRAFLDALQQQIESQKISVAQARKALDNFIANQRKSFREGSKSLNKKSDNNPPNSGKSSSSGTGSRGNDSEPNDVGPGR